MFKNAQIYRLNHPINKEVLNDGLEVFQSTPISSNEFMRQGFAAQRDGTFVYSAMGYSLIELVTDRRVLPSAVVNQIAKERALELEKKQGFYPGKKAVKEIKERVYDELLPQAFVKRDVIRAIITSEWLIVDASAASKADDVIKMLLKSYDRMPIESWRVQASPVGRMTSWLQDDEAPIGFTIDMDAVMQATGESKAQVAYKRHTLEPDELGRHIKSGKQCVRLAMTWSSKISFVLDQSLAIKSIKMLDILKENNFPAANADERFDNDLILFAGEFVKMLNDLSDALGGLVEEKVAA